jgi:hypothetical protein
MRISKFFSGRPLDEVPGRPINQDERQLTGSHLPPASAGNYLAWTSAANTSVRGVTVQVLWRSPWSGLASPHFSQPVGGFGLSKPKTRIL